MIHKLAIEIADPSFRLHRVGRIPDPLLLAPFDHQTWMGRFDDSRRRLRTLYAAEDPLTCYYERLQKFRPSLELLALLEQLNVRAEERYTTKTDSDFFDYEKLINEVGTLDRTYFLRYARIEFAPEGSQQWLDLRDPDVLRQLRGFMAPWLHANGLDDFDFSDVVARDKKVTQHIASLAIDSKLAGIISVSRLNPLRSCWAIFEGARIRPNAIRLQLPPNDRDLAKVLNDFNIRLVGDASVAPIAEAEVISTGGIVHGTEPVAASAHNP